MSLSLPILSASLPFGLVWPAITVNKARHLVAGLGPSLLGDLGRSPLNRGLLVCNWEVGDM